MSYLNSVKNNFNKFFNDLYFHSNCEDKFVREQNYLDNEIHKVSLDILKGYNEDKQAAYDFLTSQKNLSRFYYLG